MRKGELGMPLACLLLIHSETTAYPSRMVLPKSRVGLPTWVNPVSQTCFKICLVGDSRSHQLDINHHPDHCRSRENKPGPT